MKKWLPCVVFVLFFWASFQPLWCEVLPLETRREFEEKYAVWHKEAARYRAFLADDSGIHLDSFKKGIVGLGVKCLPILIERMHQDVCLAYAVTLITDWRFVPGEKIKKKILGFKDLADFYSSWWKAGQGGVKNMFIERNARWLSVKDSLKSEQMKNALRDIEYLGVAALPYLFDVIRGGETAFIPIVSKLTKSALKCDSSIGECNSWWETNQDSWMIPFPDNDPK